MQEVSLAPTQLMSMNISRAQGHVEAGVAGAVVKASGVVVGVAVRGRALGMDDAHVRGLDDWSAAARCRFDRRRRAAVPAWKIALRLEIVDSLPLSVTVNDDKRMHVSTTLLCPWLLTKLPVPRVLRYLGPMDPGSSTSYTGTSRQPFEMENHLLFL